MLYLISNYNRNDVKCILYEKSLLCIHQNTDLSKNLNKDDIFYFNLGIKDLEYFYYNNISQEVLEYYLNLCIEKYISFLDNLSLNIIIVKLELNPKLAKLIDKFNEKISSFKCNYNVISYKELDNLIDNHIINNPTYKTDKLAIYTYNFGDYRDEIKNIEILNINNNFNYYFYTEKIIVSKKWNVINFDLIPGLDFISSSRLTTKYIKYKYIPVELRPYKYILHIDCRRIKYLNKINLNSILQKLESNDVSYYCRKHPFNKNLTEEFEFIKKKHMENYSNLKNWIKFIKNQNFKQTITHFENCIYIRDITNTKLNTIFDEVYEYLLKFKLNRDQLVFIYLLQKYNFFNFKILDEFNL